MNSVLEADSMGRPQSHSTLAVVERSAEGHGFILKPLKQKLFIDGVSYLLQEIYGIENKNTNSLDSDSKVGIHFWKEFVSPVKEDLKVAQMQVAPVVTPFTRVA